MIQALGDRPGLQLINTRGRDVCPCHNVRRRRAAHSPLADASGRMRTRGPVCTSWLVVVASRPAEPKWRPLQLGEDAYIFILDAKNLTSYNLQIVFLKLDVE